MYKVKTIFTSVEIWSITLRAFSNRFSQENVNTGDTRSTTFWVVSHHFTSWLLMKKVHRCKHWIPVCAISSNVYAVKFSMPDPMSLYLASVKQFFHILLSLHHSLVCTHHVPSMEYGIIQNSSKTRTFSVEETHSIKWSPVYMCLYIIQ